MAARKPRAHDTTICVIDTQTHALAARAMRLSLAAMDFDDALFISDDGGDTGGARHLAIPPLDGRAAYSRFVIKELGRYIATRHVLLIQWDGYLVNPAAWDDRFLEYDYIGARWGAHRDGHDVGNGGFSLRSRRLLDALRDPDINRHEPEDELICRQYRPMLEARHGIRFAPAALADRFSFETTYPEGTPLGFHGLFNLWRFVTDEELPGLVANMPRSTLGSIQFRQLARNLLDLKRPAGARTLLAARLNAYPADAESRQWLAALDASAAPTRPAVGRNEPCPCGSGKRYKHCCGQAETAPPPTDPVETLLRQAAGQHQAGRLAEARASYQTILSQADNAIAEHYLGVLDMQEGRPADAEARMRSALAKRDDLPDFHNNLGLCLRAQDRLEEAIAAYRAALDRHPGYAPAWSNLGLDLHRLGHLDDALDAFNRTLALDANLAQARFSRALVLLARGDYARGWEEYEWRARCPEHAAGYRAPPIQGTPRPWRGEPLAGKRLLLLAEQGIGDTLQFIRYVRQLTDQGARVSLYVHRPHIVSLLRGVTGLVDIHAGGGTGGTPPPLPAHDYVCHLLSLPRLCGTRSLADIPSRVPYLSVPEARRLPWRQRLADLPARMKIGIAWAGSPGNADDRNRSCPLTHFSALFDLPGIVWINLQLGAGREQLTAVPNPILDWGDEQTDYLETAALMSELDLILTVDTSIAHAAGALAVPVWVMLPRAPDFRWLLERDDSPWYPSARLFRQPRPGDWPSVMADIRAALGQRLNAR